MKKTITLILILTLGVAVQVANADFTFGEPTNLGPEINGSGEEAGACLSPDGLSLYFQRTVNNIGKIWVTRRTTPDSEWGPPSNLLSGAGPGQGIEPVPRCDQSGNWQEYCTDCGVRLYFLLGVES